MTVTVDMAVATHRGKVRAHNEDCLAADPRAGLAVVADGMGGHNAGEVASRMTVDAIVRGVAAAIEAHRQPLERVRAETLIASVIESANRTVYRCASARSDYAGMGTTVVVGLWYGRHVSVGHVGDSRLYRLRRGRFEQLTRDHTLVQEQIELGWMTPASAREAANRSILTRAVGSDARVQPDLATFETMVDDVYLLCSDGLTEMLTDTEIVSVLRRSDQRLQEITEALVHAANARGGVDNISVVLVRVIEAAKLSSGGNR